MAIFTTMAVLGGGEQDPPQWLIGNEGNWEGGEEEEENAALPAPGEGIGEAHGEDVHLTDEESLTETEIESEELGAENSEPTFEDKMAALAEKLDSIPEEKSDYSSSSES